jgi:hypothetical protein
VKIDHRKLWEKDIYILVMFSDGSWSRWTKTGEMRNWLWWRRRESHVPAGAGGRHHRSLSLSLRWLWERECLWLVCVCVLERERERFVREWGFEVLKMDAWVYSFYVKIKIWKYYIFVLCTSNRSFHTTKKLTW